VPGIAKNGLIDCTSLTEITLPTSIVRIGDNAFAGCTSLTKVTLSDGITTVGNGVFADSDIREVVVASGSKTITSTMIIRKNALESIVIPETVTSIGVNAFEDCENLTDVYYEGTRERWEEVVINSGNEYLTSATIHCAAPWYLSYEIVDGEATITSCDISVEEDIVLPDTVGGYPVTTIGENAFRNCISLTEITIPNSVTTIGDSAFQYCESLTTVNIPDSVTSVGSNAFDGCYSLNYNQYDNAYYLGNAENPYYALVKATSTTASSCKVHKDTQLICGTAFLNCSNMVDISISDSVAWIGEEAFVGCNSLREVYYAGTESQWEQIVIEEGNECLITATIRYESEELTIVETNALAGASFSVRLIEPWAMRVTVTYYKGQQPNHVKLNLADLTSYGAYAILGSKFEAAENATLEDLLNDADTIHFEMSDVAAEGKIYPVNATQAMFDFYDGLYTYRLNEAVYLVTYYEDAEGLHFSRVRSKTLVETIDGLKNLSEKESNVYTSMKAMEASVTAYRATLPSSALGTVYPAGLSITDSGIAFGADPAPGTYKFGTSVSIKLIEPWGLKADVRIVDSSNATIDYTTADDYGVIFFHDKDGKYTESGMTADDILAEAGAQVYANSLGNATLAGDRVSAIYDQGIFTYEMNSNVYAMPFVVVNGQYYYRNTGAFCYNLIAQVDKFAGETTTRSAEEIAVYNAMISMNENILIYRGN